MTPPVIQVIIIILAHNYLTLLKKYHEQCMKIVFSFTIILHTYTYIHTYTFLYKKKRKTKQSEWLFPLLSKKMFKQSVLNPHDTKCETKISFTNTHTCKNKFTCLCLHKMFVCSNTRDDVRLSFMPIAILTSSFI